MRRREKKVWATENRSRKSRCENKSSNITALFSEITSRRELKELPTDLNLKSANLFRYPKVSSL